MAMKRLTIALCGLLALAGCSSSGGEDDQNSSWARQIRFIDPAHLGDRDYEELGVIDEQAAITANGEEAAVDRAKDGMRRRAAAVDADAVVIVECGRFVDPDDPSIRAASTVRCRGVAIRWKTP
jgi:hypothetical protein